MKFQVKKELERYSPHIGHIPIVHDLSSRTIDVFDDIVGEIINDAECGLLCDLSDEGLYGALKSVLDNPQMIDEWKETLKDTKKNFFASERVKRLYNIFGV